MYVAATFEKSNESLDFWGENFHPNVALSHRLMTLAQECPSAGRIVFASSYLVYDQNLYQFSWAQKIATRLQKGDRLKPRKLTGMAKLAAEMELICPNFRNAIFPQFPLLSLAGRGATRGMSSPVVFERRSGTKVFRSLDQKGYLITPTPQIVPSG